MIYLLDIAYVCRLSFHNRICDATSNMETCRALEYLRCEQFEDPVVDLTEICPEDDFGPGCQLTADNSLDFIVAIVNSDIRVADKCKNMKAERFAVGTFHPTANDLQQLQSDPHNFKKVRLGWS